MYLVGNPRPTNPEGKMAAVAKRRGWPILRFNSRGGVGLRRQLRTLAGFGSMFPVAAGAVGIGVSDRQPAARRELLHLQLLPVARWRSPACI